MWWPKSKLPAVQRVDARLRGFLLCSPLCLSSLELLFQASSIANAQLYQNNHWVLLLYIKVPSTTPKHYLWLTSEKLITILTAFMLKYIYVELEWWVSWSSLPWDDVRGWQPEWESFFLSSSSSDAVSVSESSLRNSNELGIIFRSFFMALFCSDLDGGLSFRSLSGCLSPLLLFWCVKYVSFTRATQSCQDRIFINVMLGISVKETRALLPLISIGLFWFMTCILHTYHAKELVKDMVY